MVSSNTLDFHGIDLTCHHDMEVQDQNPTQSRKQKRAGHGGGMS